MIEMSHCRRFIRDVTHHAVPLHLRLPTDVAIVVVTQPQTLTVSWIWLRQVAG